ncbi:MAG: CvpA family protein, partial [Candidatus Sericytochromatia bacterium]
MIWLDWIIVAIVGYNVVTGLFSGFLRSLINLVALVVAYLLTPVVKGPLAAIVQASFGLQDYLAVPLGAFLAWTLVYVAISAAGMILSKIVNMTPLMIVDRLGGA